MKNGIIILILGALLLLTGLFFLGKKDGASDNNNATTTPQVADNSFKPAVLVTESATTTYSHYTITYPKSSNTELPEVYNLVQDVKNEFVKEYGNLTKEQADKMYIRADDPYEMIATTKIVTSEKTVSYIVQIYQYTGGAHGGASVSTFTYDKKGSLVTIDKVLESNYLDVIAPMARDYFYINLGEYKNPTMIDDGTRALKDNYSAWYLLDDDIVFIFGQYQVGPYVLGIQEYKIDKSKINAILKAEYK